MYRDSMKMFTGANRPENFPRTNKKTHGMWGTSTYEIWNSMKRRCINPSNPQYFRYGGRGIGICERWLVFSNFLEDMGIKPEGLELDRIDNSLGYYKENCRWVSHLKNCSNRRRYQKSKYPRGVSKVNNMSKFRAHIVVDYVQYYIGIFDTVEEAGEAYRKIYREWNGSEVPEDMKH